MNHNFKHQGCPVQVSWESGDDEAQYFYLDLGYPGDSIGNLRGPRIAVRRLQGGANGWRILIHPNEGDPIKSFEITDATAEEPPTIVEAEE
jgi:hypothetical protein